MRRAPHICDSIDGKINMAPNATTTGIICISDTGSELVSMLLENQYCIISAQALESMIPENRVAVVPANGGLSALLRNRDKLNPQQNPAAIAHQSPTLWGTGNEKPPPSNSQTPTSAAAIMAS